MGALVYGLCRLFGFRKRKTHQSDLKNADHCTNTAKMGVRFNDKVRNAFRYRWLKIAQRGVSRKE